MRVGERVKLIATTAEIRNAGFRRNDTLVIVKRTGKTITVRKPNGENTVVAPITHFRELITANAKVKDKPVIQRITSKKIDGYTITFYPCGRGYNYKEPARTSPCIAFGCKSITLEELKSMLIIKDMAERNWFSFNLNSSDTNIDGIALARARSMELGFISKSSTTINVSFKDIKRMITHLENLIKRRG